MEKKILIIPIIIILTIFFYPTTSNSNSTGSVGGKTGSPDDIGNCMGCHTDAITGQGVTITTNIPSAGYEPGNLYNITIDLNTIINFGSGKAGFEVTCEENTTNTKAGLFGITNPNSTKFTNNSSAITHTTAGNNLNTWSFNWVAPISGTGDITFYGAFIEAGYPIGSNSGDYFSSSTLSFSEATVNSSINLFKEKYFTFNSVSKTILSLDNSDLSVFNLDGKLILSSNKKYTSLSHLSDGIYIIKSEKNTQKVILN